MSRLRLLLRIGAAVVAFAVVAIKSAVLAKVLPADPLLESWTLIVGAALVLLDSIGTIINGQRLKRSAKLDADVRRLLVGMLVALSETPTPSVDLTQLGASVFLVKRSRLPWRDDKLVRLVRFRLRDTPQPSDVEWVKGKGCIGKAWQDKKITHHEIRPIAAKYGSADLSQANFDRIAPRTQRGFTLPEFRNIIGKYAEVLAVPIQSDDDATAKVIGILSVDVPMTVAHPALGSILESTSAETVAATCASTIGHQLSNA